MIGKKKNLMFVFLVAALIVLVALPVMGSALLP